MVGGPEDFIKPVESQSTLPTLQARPENPQGHQLSFQQICMALT